MQVVGHTDVRHTRVSAFGRWSITCHMSVYNLLGFQLTFLLSRSWHCAAANCYRMTGLSWPWSKKLHEPVCTSDKQVYDANEMAVMVL